MLPLSGSFSFCPAQPSSCPSLWALRAQSSEQSGSCQVRIANSRPRAAGAGDPEALLPSRAAGFGSAAFRCASISARIRGNVVQQLAALYRARARWLTFPPSGAIIAPISSARRARWLRLRGRRSLRAAPIYSRPRAHPRDDKRFSQSGCRIDRAYARCFRHPSVPNHSHPGTGSSRLSPGARIGPFASAGLPAGKMTRGGCDRVCRAPPEIAPAAPAPPPPLPTGGEVGRGASGAPPCPPHLREAGQRLGEPIRRPRQTSFPPALLDRASRPRRAHRC